MFLLHSKYLKTVGTDRRCKQLREARSRKRVASAERQPNKTPAVVPEVAEVDVAVEPSHPRKRGRSREKFDLFNIEAKVDEAEYFIVHSSSLQDIVSGCLCKLCKQNNLSVKIVNKQGFAFKVIVRCSGCGEVLSDTASSPRISSESTRPPFDVNRKVVEAFVRAGAGYSAMQKFGTHTGMQVMDQSSYRSHLISLCLENVELKKEVLKLAREAVRKAYELNDPSLATQAVIDVKVTFDGSWHKRGFTSLYGFVSVIEVVTGLVIDFEIISKYCHICAVNAAELGEESTDFKKWKKQHQEMGECSINFDGFSGTMEREGAVILWKRSVADAKMRYMKYVSDGDAKSLTAINEAEPYGEGVLVEKEECINHVGKRLGTALRNTVSDFSKRGVTLGGKAAGSLTQVKIDKLQGYYQKAMIDNAPDVKAMQNAIMAAPHHYASTDKKPLHQHCPKGKESWCFYQKAKADKPRCKPSHSEMKTTLNDKVFKAILPVYKRLSEKDLVERCKGLLTQNANESLHNVVWSHVPKINFVSKGRLELGATQAVGQYNMGMSSMLALTDSLAERPTSAQSMRNAEEIDRKRLSQSDSQSEVETKKARIARKKAKKSKKKKKGDQDMYSAGGGD